MILNVLKQHCRYMESNSNLTMTELHLCSVKIDIIQTKQLSGDQKQKSTCSFESTAAWYAKPANLTRVKQTEAT